MGRTTTAAASWRSIAAAFAMVVAACGWSQSPSTSEERQGDVAQLSTRTSRAFGGPLPAVRVPSFVVGPMPMVSPDPCTTTHGGCLRQDFVGAFQSGATESLRRADTVELYVEMLTRNRDTPPAQKYDLSALAVATASKKIAFQVGTVLVCDPTSDAGCPICELGIGKRGGDSDALALADWVAAGGRVDEIILDNAYFRLVKACPKALTITNPSFHPLDYITTETTDYLAAIRQAFPNVRLVLTDGIGQFKFVADARVAVPYGPTIAGYDDLLDDYLRGVQQKASARGFPVSEFVIDFLDAVESDATTHQTSAVDTRTYDSGFVVEGGADFDRLLLAEDVARANGMAAGVYFNSFTQKDASADILPLDPLGAARTRDRTLRFLADYASVGGKPDAFHFVYWHRYPQTTGPETNPLSAFGVLRDGLRLAQNAPDEIGFFRPESSTLESFLASVDDPPFRKASWAVPGSPVVGDWDGDGVATLGLYDPATAVVRLTNSSSAPAAAALPAFVFGLGGRSWVPLAGDWNGDGKESIGAYDPATSTFYLRNQNTTGIADITFVFGNAGGGYVPLAGDWDGDGKATAGLFQPSTATFFLWTSNPQHFADETYTVTGFDPSMVPVVGDWDGDGRDTPALVRTSDPTRWTVTMWNGATGGPVAVAAPDTGFVRPKAASPGGSAVVALAGRWQKF